MNNNQSYNEEGEEDFNNYYEEEEEEERGEEKQKSKPSVGKGGVQYYKDQPYDLAYEINESVSEAEISQASRKDDNQQKEQISNGERQDDEEEEEDEYDTKAIGKGSNTYPAVLASSSKPLPKFDFSEFYNLNTTGEVKELLQIMNKYVKTLIEIILISLFRFSATEVSLDTKLKPFIPSYIPSIGEVDAFIKVSRPDNFPEDLGFSVIDEPIINGVDPYIFKLELIDKSKVKVDRYEVKSVPEAEKNPKALQNWIEKITELRKTKTSSSVSYSKKMPDFESLMQVWPDKIEAAFKDIPLPDEKLNISLENYASIVCNLLDVPVHKLDQNRSLIEALHVIFTLYSEFRVNQHFQRNGSKEDNVQSMKFY
jgi:intraflagellar transport protein 46